MKLMLLFPLLAVGVFAVTAATHAEEKAGAAVKGKGTLYHVVNFKFKEGASREKIQEVEEAFQSLRGKIGGVRSLDWGTNVSPEGLDKGFTHCFILTYASEADRDAYLQHPEHQARDY